MAYEGSYQGTELVDAEILVHSQDEAATKDSDIYAVTNFNVTTEPRPQNRRPTVNAGTRTVLGAVGNVTGSVTMKVNASSSGQDKIDHAYKEQEKVTITTKTKGKQLGEDIVLSATDTFSVSTTGVLGNTSLVGKIANETGKGENLRGCTLVIGTDRYFVERVDFADDDTVSQVKIGSERADRDNYPFTAGTVVPDDNSGTLKIYANLDVTTTYVGTPQNNVSENIEASTDGTNEPEATVTFALDGEGNKSITIPA